MPYLYKKVNCDSLACCPYLYVALLIVKGKKKQAMDNKSQNTKKSYALKPIFTFFPPKIIYIFFHFLPFLTFMTKYVYDQHN